MKKLIRNKKLVILIAISLIICICVLIGLCISNTGKDPYEGFSEEGMQVIDVQDEDEDKDVSEEENQLKEEEIKAPSNWGENETPSLDGNGNQSQDSNEGSNNGTNEDSKDDNPNTEGGYGPLF